MTNYYFLTRKIKIEEAKDIQITEKGSLKIETINGFKKIRGTGIYDNSLFRKEKEINPDVNFYIKLNSKTPSIFCNYSIFRSNAKIVKGLLEFKFIMYDGVIIKDIDNFDFVNCDDNLFEYGEEAALAYLWNNLNKMKKLSDPEKFSIYSQYEEWFAFNNTNCFLIPDLSLRKPKLIKNGKEIINPNINILYEKLFDINEYNTLFFNLNVPKFMKFFSSINIYKIRAEIEEGLYSILSSGKKSLVKKEGISQKLSGAIRGTIVPNPFIEEDEIEIGTIFADYLYPEFRGLWNNSTDLNYLISKGVLKIPNEVFKYEIDWITEEEIKELKKNKNNSYLYEYFYPWWEERYSFIPEEKLVEIKESINRKRLDFYKNNQSDVPYYVVVDRNPTICQLSMFSARPVFRDSIGNTMFFNENADKISNVSSLKSSIIEDATGRQTIDYSDYCEDILSINPLVCDGMNADFDGDILLVIPLYTVEANLEAMNLRASLNYITVDSGNIRNSIPKEFMFAMKMIYQKSPDISKQINDIFGADLSFDEAKKSLSYISRDKYEKIFDILKNHIWQYGGGLTFKDMKDGIEIGKINNKLVHDLESEEDILALLNKVDKNYSSEESEKFILKVKASNVTEIADSGYFYKKLASCMDSISTTLDDCGSEGTEIEVSRFFEEGGEELFDFKIKDMFVTELDREHSRFDHFIEDVTKRNLKTIHYRSPISCLESNNRCFCKKCCGKISAGGRELNNDNIGIIATLAITENVTQSSLSSMNNGISENVNVVLEKPFKTKNNSSFESFVNEIKSICDNMSGVGVESRWYEIALLGRVYRNNSSKSDNEDKYMSTTFISSSRTNDAIGAFLFRPSKDNLFKLLCGDSGYGNNFLIKSCKAKNLFGLF